MSAMDFKVDVCEDWWDESEPEEHPDGADRGGYVVTITGGWKVTCTLGSVANEYKHLQYEGYYGQSRPDLGGLVLPDELRKDLSKRMDGRNFSCEDGAPMFHSLLKRFLDENREAVESFLADRLPVKSAELKAALDSVEGENKDGVPAFTVAGVELGPDSDASDLLESEVFEPWAQLLEKDETFLSAWVGFKKRASAWTARNKRTLDKAARAKAKRVAAENSETAKVVKADILKRLASEIRTASSRLGVLPASVPFRKADLLEAWRIAVSRDVHEA